MQCGTEHWQLGFLIDQREQCWTQHAQGRCLEALSVFDNTMQLNLHHTQVYLAGSCTPKCGEGLPV